MNEFLKVNKISTTIGKRNTLYITWLDFDPFMKLNFEKQFISIIDKIRNENIINIVLDTSRRRHDPTDKEFKEIFQLFFSGLSETGLTKFARVNSKEFHVNEKFQNFLFEIKRELDSNFELQNFTTCQLALEWLKQDA